MSFPVDRLDFDLPRELIAQVPAEQRGGSRLMVVHRDGSTIEDRRFSAFTEFLRSGDTLVVNDTRVLPARFAMQRDSGGKVEGLFLRQASAMHWEVMLKGASRVRVGERLEIKGESGGRGSPDWVYAEQSLGRGRWVLCWPAPTDAGRKLREIGRMPLPPYIKRHRERDARDDLDRSRYQTAYASRDGAIAAPTAGLHFDDQTFAAIKGKRCDLQRVTLHVGYGTFAPVTVDDLAEHSMHAEYFEISDRVCRSLSRVRSYEGRVLAVGTTSARVLETAFRRNEWSGGLSGWTDLFCYPPFEFCGVDALLTNFHLPRSTLIALVMAFAGEDLIRKAYEHAIERRYRFYSYGDAMLIL